MIATIRFKDILKYLVITTILIGIFVFIARFFLANKKLKVEKKEKQYNLLSCLNIAMPITKTIENNKVIVADNKENKRNSKTTSRSGLIRILDMELLEIEEKEDEIEQTKENVEEKNEKKEKTEIKDTYTNQYKSVKVKNLTENIKLTESILKPDYNVSNKKDIIIYDYVDDNFVQTRNMFLKRKKTYEKLGYNIVEDYEQTKLNI